VHAVFSAECQGFGDLLKKKGLTFQPALLH